MDEEVRLAMDRLRRVNNLLLELLEVTLQENYKLLQMFNEGISGSAPILLSGILDEYNDFNLLGAI